MEQAPTDHKLIIYQLLPRLFGNVKTLNKTYGSIEENGVGKFNDINDIALQEIKKMGFTHVWFTGIIEHATITRFGVNNLKGFEDENGKILFPAGSLETLFSIAFSHMRAILAKNNTGSRFTNFIVPVINPNTLFNELLQINIEAVKKMKERADISNEEFSSDNPNIDETGTIEEQLAATKERIKKLNKTMQSLQSENAKKEIKKTNS